MSVPILEVAIGLCFVYLLLSLICTSTNEAIASLTKRRGKMLYDAIANLVGSTGLRDQLYAHPVIRSLAKTSKDFPSYIPPQKFALALMDIVTGKGKSATDGVALRQGVSAIQNNDHLQQSLSTVLADSRAHLQTDQQKIQDWYDDAMDRVSGWYKRRTAVWIWAIALVVTLFINANTVAIFKVLWTNQTVRSSLVDAAKARSEASGGEAMPLVEYTDPQNPQESKPVNPGEALTPGEQALLGELVVGWKADLNNLAVTDDKASWWGTHVLGWLLTMVALSLGAPFWFDLLNKFMNIRNSGKSPAEAARAAAPAETRAAKGATA
jgi:hypothetical protein